MSAAILEPPNHPGTSHYNLWHGTNPHYYDPLSNDQRTGGLRPNGFYDAQIGDLGKYFAPSARSRSGSSVPTSVLESNGQGFCDQSRSAPPPAILSRSSEKAFNDIVSPAIVNMNSCPSTLQLFRDYYKSSQMSERVGNEATVAKAMDLTRSVLETLPSSDTRLSAAESTQRERVDTVDAAIANIKSRYDRVSEDLGAPPNNRLRSLVSKFCETLYTETKIERDELELVRTRKASAHRLQRLFLDSVVSAVGQVNWSLPATPTSEVKRLDAASLVAARQIAEDTRLLPGDKTSDAAIETAKGLIWGLCSDMLPDIKGESKADRNDRMSHLVWNVETHLASRASSEFVPEGVQTDDPVLTSLRQMDEQLCKALKRKRARMSRGRIGGSGDCGHRAGGDTDSDSSSGSRTTVD